MLKTKTNLICNHQATISFMAFRMIFKVAAQETVATKNAPKENPAPSAQELLKVLEQKKGDEKWNNSKDAKKIDEKVIDDNFERLATKLYPNDKKNKIAALTRLKETFDMLGDREANLKILAEKKCATFEVDNEVLKFYDKDKQEIVLPVAARVETPPPPGAKKEEAKSATTAVEKKNSPEFNPEPRASLEFFQKNFVHAKPGQIQVSKTESINPGTTGDLNLRGYLGNTKEAEPDYYAEDGHGGFLQPDRLKTRSFVPAEIVNGYVIEAPKKDGKIGKFVLVKLTLDQVIGGKSEIKAWVEVENLRNKGYEHQKFNQIANAWTMNPEISKETVKTGPYKVLTETMLIRGKGPRSGENVRSMHPGEEVTVEDENVRKVGDDEYVNVTIQSQGGSDHGYVRRTAIMTVAEKQKPQQVAYVPEKKDEKANEKVVNKYFDTTTNTVHFDGDKNAEQRVTINDLFPKAKGGANPDTIKIQHAKGGKLEVATFDANKEFTKKIDGKKVNYKGTFVDSKGERVMIWEGDKIFPSWNTKESYKDPVDRVIREKYELKPGETYESAAEKAFAINDIKNAYDGSKLTPQEQKSSYINLILKPYQQGNTLLFIVPTPSEALIRTNKELAEDRHRETFRNALKGGELKRNEIEAEFRKNKNYRDKVVKIDDSLSKAMDDEDLWTKAWNRQGNNEVSGMDQLILALHRPIFIEAGVTFENIPNVKEANARKVVLGIIRIGDHQEVEFKDVIKYFKEDPDHLHLHAIYDGDIDDYNERYKKDTKILEDNEAGMRVFRDKTGGEVLKQTEIINLVTEKSHYHEYDPSKYKNYNEYIWEVVEHNPSQYQDYFKAMVTLEEAKKDPNYQAWETYKMAAADINYLNDVAVDCGKLLEAIEDLKLKNVEASANKTEKLAQGSQASLDAIDAVFHESDKAKSKKGRSFSWEDMLAGTKEEEEEARKTGMHYDESSAILRTQKNIAKYGEKDKELDGVKRLTEKATIHEFNRLMKKSLTRLITLKHNPTAAAEFLNKYSGNKIDIPKKAEGEDGEAYAVRVTPLLTNGMASAYENLKITKLNDLNATDDDPDTVKEKVNDQKELIRWGYYLDSRDVEKGLVENHESSEAPLSLNPFVRKIQENAIEGEYPREDVKTIENIFIGGAAVKIDTTKSGLKGLGLGVGTGIDIGHGFTVLIGVGVDEIGGSPNPVVSVAVRKSIKFGEDNDKKLNLTAGGAAGLTGPSAVAGVDFSFPISDSLDMTLFAGGSVGILVAGAGGGIGIGKNYESAQKNLEKEIGEIDTKEIDKETDPQKKYLMIINNPKIGPYFRVAAQEFKNPQDQQRVVLDIYNTWRKNVGNNAVTLNSAPFISGGGVFAGAVMIAGVPIPYVGPYLTFTVDKTTFVYRRPSEESKKMDAASQQAVQAHMMAQMEKAYSGKNLKFSSIEAVEKVQVGESADVMIGADGRKVFVSKKFTVDFAPFKQEPSIKKYNEVLKPYNMKLVPDGTGLLEFQVYGALGNVQMLMDPAMENNGLILKNNRVYLAPGKNPELFITREEFSTPFEDKGCPQNTIITITNTPKRTRAMIHKEAMESGSYLYQKAVNTEPDETKVKKWEHADWEIVAGAHSKPGNIMGAGRYEQEKGKLEHFHEKVKGFDEKKWNAYDSKIHTLRFVREPEPELSELIVTELKGFSKRFLKANQEKYKEYTTTVPQVSAEKMEENRVKLATLIQGEAKKGGPPKGQGLGLELHDKQMHFVMSELIDLSFMELKNVRKKREGFEKNLKFAKPLLVAHFTKKIDELKNRGIDIKTSPKTLADLVEKHLLENVTDADLEKVGTKNANFKQLGPNWVVSSIAGAIGKGMRGMPGYITQQEYGLIGFKNLNIASSNPAERDLAKTILEIESPLDSKNDKAFADSILAQKTIAMPGMWFVLGDALANEAVDGMSNAAKGEDMSKNAGYQEFKKIVTGIRTTQLKGGNAYIYNINGNSFEFRINTEIATAGHGRCTNATLAAKEEIKIYARIKPNETMIFAAGSDNVATISPETSAKYLSFGLAGVVTIAVGPDDTPPPPGTPPPEKPGETPKPPGTPGTPETPKIPETPTTPANHTPSAGPGGRVTVDQPGQRTPEAPTGSNKSE